MLIKHMLIKMLNSQIMKFQFGYYFALMRNILFSKVFEKLKFFRKCISFLGRGGTHISIFFFIKIVQMHRMLPEPYIR